ncbi:4-alpha-glucanotransferase [Waddlia chondrophila]|uniref:4-alpha-glucanotransferase n=1 Tax=Waddlia chondrophila TaxID=71667 RepID=UPI0002FDC959|nr:4-alpha-glucanotransferase [Waddlia chondrophila]
MISNWEKVGNAKRYGISIPIHALHSKTTYGIGEFLELIKLFPWIKSMGFSAVQLHPLCDTRGMANPHLPYSPFAFNPLFLSLTEIPHSNDKEELYLQKTINYTSAAKFKETLLIKFYYDHGETVFESDAFIKFSEENPWLDNYVGLKNQDPRFYQFIQFLCHQQMKQVKTEAEKHGILLISEIPTQLQAEAPDVKYHPSWFTIDNDKAGCNWSEMERDGYSWWKERFFHAAAYFDACKFDRPIDSNGFFKEISTGLPLLLILNELQTTNLDCNSNLCPTVIYPNREQCADHSLTILDKPSKFVSREQCKQLIKHSHSTSSLLHMISLTTYLSLIPNLNWIASTEEDADQWSLSIKPSVEELILDPSLREVMQECLVS